MEKLNCQCSKYECPNLINYTLKLSNNVYFFVMLDFPPKEIMSIKPVKALIRKYLACRSVSFNGYQTP